MKIERELKKYYQGQIYKNKEDFFMEKKKKNLIWGISGLLAACCVIGYFAFFYPWPSSSDNSATLGTIGGVEKVNRQRVEQIKEKDVLLSVMEM